METVSAERAEAKAEAIPYPGQCWACPCGVVYPAKIVPTAAAPVHCSCGEKITNQGGVVPCKPRVGAARSVGYHLTKFLGWFGWRDNGKCNCSELAAEMNELGPAGCRREFARLAAAMEKNATAKHVPFAGWGARRALMWAIRKAEKEAAAGAAEDGSRHCSAGQ